MNASPSLIRSTVLTGLLALSAAALPLAGAAQTADHASPAMLSCPAAVQGPEWTALAQFLQVRGLALATQCPSSRGAVQASLVVLDSVKASALLRGPLADGEAVETGEIAAQTHGIASAGSDEWSPDVRFNRDWLASAMKQHRLVETADGAWAIKGPQDLVRIALR